MNRVRISQIYVNTYKNILLELSKLHKMVINGNVQVEKCPKSACRNDEIKDFNTLKIELYKKCIG